MKFLQCIFSPRLYRTYGDGPYKPHGLEKWGDKVLTSAHTIFNLGIYASPMICFYFYKSGYIHLDYSRSLFMITGCLGCILGLSYLIRGVGRATNDKYSQFVTDINKPKTDQKAYLDAIQKYDFEFSSWPVTYAEPRRHTKSWLELPVPTTESNNMPGYKKYPIKILAFIATHTFALRLIYPGSLSLIHYLFDSALQQGRTQLVESLGGDRAKIRTSDGNELDTMFVDMRGDTTNGETLVICCEGNSGFYEVGIMTTPVKAGYSALGWNHPGFASSTGTPFPSQENNAIDAVMQYAINELGFKPNNIVLFGWSIGGYTATWAAVQYPEIKALILDATFDDLLPLALNQMPRSWAPLVREVVRGYADLNIAELLVRYKGPVKLVRRTDDEIICLKPGQIATNRGNDLLMKLITTRHADLCDAEMMTGLFKYVGLLQSQRNYLVARNLEGKQAQSLQLINNYLHDLGSTHCTPLPEDDFTTIMDSFNQSH